MFVESTSAVVDAVLLSVDIKSLHVNDTASLVDDAALFVDIAIPVVDKTTLPVGPHAAGTN